MNLLPWITPRSDAQLLQRLANKDTTAFNELYDRHAPDVMGVIATIVEDARAADKLLQQLFWIVWERAEDLSHSRRAAVFRDWLLLTAAQLASDHVYADA